MAVVVALASVALLSGLIGTIAALRAANGQVAEDARSIGALQQLETQLLLYSRLEALGDRRHTRAEIARRIDRLSAEVAESPQTQAEAAASRKLSRRLDRYLARRSELAAMRVPSSEALSAARPEFDEASESIATLRTLRRANLERSRRRVESIWLYTVLGSVAYAVILVAGIVAVYVIFSRNVLAPLDRLCWSIRDLRNTDSPKPAPETGPTEIRQLARALNASATALARQRERQATFIAGVVHDLRTPLSALTMGLEQLQEDSVTTKKHDTTAMLGLLSRQTQRLIRMLDDLGEMARIESGRLSLDCKWHDIRDAAREIVELYRPTTSKHRLDLDVPPSPVFVWADPVRTEEVLGNLLSNAIKYSPDGGSIAIRVERRSTEAVVVVTDHGVGIPTDQIPDLFRAFMRGRVSGEIARGSGLGLSVADRIVKAHGGHIEVESTPGRGSVFRACFPALPPGGSSSRTSDQRAARASSPNLRMR